MQDASESSVAEQVGCPPVWLLGLCNFPLGAFFAVMLYTMPQLLAANGVPQPTISSVTAVGLIPSFSSFFLSPILDWRFTRRRYAVLLAMITACALIVALASLHELSRLAAAMFVGAATVNLYQAAVGGWFGSVVSPSQKGRLGAWFAIANVSGGGLTAAIAIAILRKWPFEFSAVLLAALLLAPLPVFLWVPTPAADRRLASESFREFFRDVVSLLRTPTVTWTLFLFALPAASFALTNTLSGLGRDFGASEQTVGFVNGTGVTIAGIVGCLLVPRLTKRVSPRLLYVSVGTAGALFTISLNMLARTPNTFALAVLGENAFQAAAFAIESAIVLVTIGEGSPLAATQFGLLIAAPNFPITYMQAIDGAAYGFGGLSGAVVADATIGLVACAVAGLLFSKIQVKDDEVDPVREVASIL
jgi:MFS transporter, PAT family, beta-lactamase induction signal transducer AmpG